MFEEAENAGVAATPQTGSPSDPAKAAEMASRRLIDQRLPKIMNIQVCEELHVEPEWRKKYQVMSRVEVNVSKWKKELRPLSLRMSLLVNPEKAGRPTVFLVATDGATTTRESEELKGFGLCLFNLRYGVCLW